MTKLTQDEIDAVKRVADIRFITGEDAQRWNNNRKEGEMKQFGGFAWQEKGTTRNRQSFRCIMACIGSAYTTLCLKKDSAAVPKGHAVALKTAKQKAAAKKKSHSAAGIIDFAERRKARKIA